jgi:D-3-phosphoglycerate dehydrogenase
LSIPHIDTDACRTRNIQVCHLGGQRDLLKKITPTAELTWGLIIALTRRIPWAHRHVCDGHWGGRDFGWRTPKMLSTMSLGIVGLGRLGAMVAAYGKAFGMPVFYFSPNSRDPALQRCTDLQELAGVSDIVSLHAHLTADNEKMIDQAFFRAMRAGAFFINTARGAMVDEQALLEALESGHLGGAALDVMAAEYQSGFSQRLDAHPLVRYARTHDNLIITPHYAGATVDSWIMTQTQTVELIAEALATTPEGTREC